MFKLGNTFLIDDINEKVVKIEIMLIRLRSKDKSCNFGVIPYNSKIKLFLIGNASLLDDFDN